MLTVELGCHSGCAVSLPVHVTCQGISLSTVHTDRWKAHRGWREAGGRLTLGFRVAGWRSERQLERLTANEELTATGGNWRTRTAETDLLILRKQTYSF
jgi:hypothetical protein